MRKKALLASVLFYFLALIVLLCYFELESDPLIQVSILFKGIVVSLCCMLVLLGSFFITILIPEKKEEIKKTTIWILFLSYILFLLWALLVKPMMNKDIFIFLDPTHLHNYLSNHFNMIPFYSIFTLFQEFFQKEHLLSEVVLLLSGNLLALVPFACFLKVLFVNMKKKQCFFFVVIISACFEVIQFLTFTGTCNIDDMILNGCGAMFAFHLFEKYYKKLKIKAIEYTKKYYLYE